MDINLYITSFGINNTKLGLIDQCHDGASLYIERKLEVPYLSILLYIEDREMTEMIDG